MSTQKLLYEIVRIIVGLSSDKNIQLSHQVEFKLDGSAEAALKQIEDNGYAKPYVADSRKVICLGTNLSSEKGTIDDWQPRK
ncbi:MAG: PD-(D/E)XK nuclease domain-containing protein [Prevotella sp.]